ncbi:GH92 family glycosyl hydrolase [Stenotrophomonas sp.]|uniref:GH92 family glycosyl hydrolase n=1 Tax=Stenotrophomonas sp. TaxID=69392 RepID=UPI0028A09E0A|nr:GH92 family glycosyl hydrolase [Stenotrophomonas sp.]
MRCRVLLPLLGLVAVSSVQAAGAGFSTSFEPGQPAVQDTATGLQLRTGSGPQQPYAAKAGVGSTGLHAVAYQGRGRQRLFELDVLIAPDTTLFWSVLPEIVGDDTVASSYVSVDAVLDDGTRLSGLPVRDQHGVALGAAAQGDSKTLYPQQWAYKQVRLGEVPTLLGKRVVALELDVQPAPGHPAQGWLDDIGVQSIAPALRRRPSDWVLTTRGTQSNGRFSRGNNIPAVAVPHGFNFWTPATNAGSLSWLYAWNEHNDDANRPRLQAFSLSHQPSPWMGDRQTFQVMPSSTPGIPEADRVARSLAFDRAHEVARPHEYRVRFDNGITAALAPTDHAAVFEFGFPAEGDANLLFDNVDARGGLTLDANTGTLSGYTDVRSGLSTGATRMFVYASFDQPWQRSGLIDTGRPTGYIKFAAGTRAVTMRMATSLISLEQARHNLQLEVAAGDTQAAVAERAADQWDALLGRVQVKGASEDQRITLYSNLYRLYLYPNSGAENAGSAVAPDWRYASQNSGSADNAQGNATRSFAPVRDGKVLVNNGFWDTFRTVWPAYGLLTPDHAGTLIDGFLEQYRAGGWVARWSSPGYADLMVGTSSDVAFADAWAKGVGGFDATLAYQAALKNATVMPPDRHVGRKGLAHATFDGYMSTDIDGGMSWTMESALNDFGIAQMAHGLAASSMDPVQQRRYADEAAYFDHRAAGYATVFDHSVGFFQGRNRAGQWRVAPADYNPKVWGNDYTESNGWTFAFTAPHDGNGLLALYGGRQTLADKLDAFFSTPETADVKLSGPRGYLIHEMTEARDVRMGMYAHSNQPAHHIPWMYLYAGQPWKTQRIVRDVLDRLYLGSEIGQGYPGDEDNGEMSAWYVLAAMGLYPLRMGSPDYVIGAPLFERFTLDLPQGKQLRIHARNAGRGNPYVQSLRVNGKAWTKTWIPHQVLVQGATLEFVMGPKPSRWGSRVEDAPPSLTPAGQRPTPLVDVIDAAATITATSLAAPDALTDNDARTALALRGDPIEVVVGLTTPAQATFYTLTSAERPIATASWALQGSADGVQWQTLDAREGEVFEWGHQTRPFQIDQPGRFAHYRLRITTPGRVEFAEFELLQPTTR